jgi:hypothetical protein
MSKLEEEILGGCRLSSRKGRARTDTTPLNTKYLGKAEQSTSLGVPIPPSGSFNTLTQSTHSRPSPSFLGIVFMLLRQGHPQSYLDIHILPHNGLWQ